MHDRVKEVRGRECLRHLKGGECRVGGKELEQLLVILELVSWVKGNGPSLLQKFQLEPGILLVEQGQFRVGKGVCENLFMSESVVVHGMKRERTYIYYKSFGLIPQQVPVGAVMYISYPYYFLQSY
jgi:hypothetical protein